MSAPQEALPLGPPGRAGFRLRRVEVYNWGTFHDRVWVLPAGGENVLVTGDIGSGKSTLVDALATLLVPPQRLAYNRAAGAEARERTARSYVLGHFKSERGEPGASARPVALRGADAYAVLLAVFANEGLGEAVALAQVLWFRETEGQPSRLLVVSDQDLSIRDDFSDFGAEIGALKRRLKAGGAEVFETFPPYAAAFRRRFGIDNEQALELLHQTMSMKSVGNLTEFVREHMLEPFPTGERIAELLRHFDDLEKAHAAVLKAKAQVAALEPLVADCDRRDELALEQRGEVECREALHGYFEEIRRGLLEARIEQGLEAERRTGERLEAAQERLSEARRRRDELRAELAAGGGDRLATLEGRIARLDRDVQERRERSTRYSHEAAGLGLEPPATPDAFSANRGAIEREAAAARSRQGALRNDDRERHVELHGLRRQHGELAAELASLRQRRSNLPLWSVELRDRLCAALGAREDELPFAAELVRVRDDERTWEGALERLVRSFGLSLLVPDRLYAEVARWVESTHLGGKLVYLLVRGARGARSQPRPDSAVRKLEVRHDTELAEWLEEELAARFDVTCCESLEAFRRESDALTRSGQLRRGGKRHEKDDRSRLDDRSRYVLGWSNREKIASLEAQVEALEERIATVVEVAGRLQVEATRVQERLEALQRLSAVESFRELDWQSLEAEAAALRREKRELEESSDRLRTLQAKLEEVDRELGSLEDEVKKLERDLTVREANLARDRGLVAECDQALAGLAPEVRARTAPRLEALRAEHLAGRTLTVEACPAREQELRTALQARIDGRAKQLDRLVEKIVRAMETFRRDHPAESHEMDAAVDAAPEYRRMLDRLRGDDLPRFERRFKELLNENTIREVASFQARLHRDRDAIRERVERINRSLHSIDYNRGRYVRLEPEPTADPELRDFVHDLRACTTQTLPGPADGAYSEEKFLQVSRILERFRGRDGTAELDRRWTAKVTDVRNWFTFAASERWREDDQEHEHYTDSGGKSGGQKEKLAYTVLGASLAYQLGLEGGSRARTFRFVIIDEAFGRGSDDSARYGLELFRELQLQLLVVTPLQKIHVIEPFVSTVGYVHNADGRESRLRTLTIEEYRAEKAARTA